MAIEKSLLSGSTAMLLLKLLSEKDMYGYEMIDTLRQRSENVFELKAGTLYPLLHNLESKQFLVSYEKESSGKIRKYYQITSTGKKALKEKQNEWNTYSQAVLHVLNAC
ncbi:PadR family transcriptional regulator [Mediterraneibacter butyricigenes]|uniref:PadR family transcriptional regulator n=1 Tax=Mediterraneibacter butyricigenes TaxID=2316025 RepID=A0A391P2V9_9FIRM|nr:PadR family transcriptional regulator [Mediterraneibacter butyricigenes]GCA66356.1 PadR family transcriptional regulator [Mediterraneibacter butyricigenes]